MASLDLDAISFVVKTEQLDTAITKLEKLETSLGNLSKPLKETTLASEKLAQAQAKTAQAQSKAEEAANKAAIAQARLEKATSSATTSQGKLNKATDESLDKAKALQEKLANTYKDLSQGYTKGESSVLNYARSIGIAEDALKPFQDQLKLIGKLSTDPFDSAIGSIRSITKEFEMMNHRTDLAGKGIVLSAKQLKEYSRVADEVAAKITANGLDPTKDKGLADYTKGVERLQAKYLGLASTVSDARQVEVANQQAIKDTAKANDYLTREMLRAESALAGLNENMNISSSNRLLRFKEALSAAGVEAGQAALALQKYEAVLKATDTASASKKTKNRKEELEYLARATSVQLGDIGVSLAGGQNPLIVMIQQGDQLRGVLNQVGGDAKEMQAAMSSAFRQIVVGFVDVGKALGQFVAGAFVDSSKAIVNYIGEVTTLTSRLEKIRYQFKLMEMDTDATTAAIGRFGTSMLAFTGKAAFVAATATITGFTLALAAGAVAMYQLGKEQTAIAQANAQFGGAFGASTQDVISFNKELQSVGVTSSDVSVIFTEVAKAGNIGKESFVEVTKAAADFETYVGGKAADAVKVFSETIKDPVKGLTEFGVKTGYVNQEQVELVKKLIETGQGAEAQKLAIGFLEQGYAKMTTNAKAGMSSLDLSLSEAGKSLSELWDSFKNSQGVGEGFRLLWETVAVIGSEVWFTLKAVGIEIGGIGAQIAAVLRGDFSGAKTIGEQMKQDAEVAAKAQEELVKRILDRSKVQKDANSEERKTASAKLALSKENEIVEKALAKSDKDALSRSEYQKKQLEELNKQLVNRKVTTEELARLEKKWGEDWDKAHKQKKDPTESFFASSIKTFAADTAKAVGIQEQYTKAQVDFLKIASDPKWLKLTEDERAAIAVKAEAAAKEEVLAKAYLATKKAEEDAAKATSNIANEIEKLIGIKSKSIQFQQMLDEQLMLGNITFEQSVKAINDYSAALDKISSDKAEKTSRDLSQNAADRLALIKEESEDLKLQKSIYGFFTVDQKRILEQAKVTRDLRKEILGIEKLTTLEIDKGGITAAQAEKHKTEAYEAAAEKRKNIEQAAALEMYKYYSDALADVISTSLYEGGKAGSKKLRDLIIAELKKPITVVVNAVVSTIMNSVTGGVASASGSSMLGAAGASFVGSSSALSLGAQAGFGALLNGGGFEAMGSAFTALTEGTMASFAAGLGTLAGVLGPIAGVAMLLSSLDDSGTYHTGGGASYNAATGAVESSVGFQLNPRDVSLSAVDFAKQFTTAIGQTLDATALAFGKTAGYEIATAFADDVSSDGAWGSLVIKKGTETILDWSKTQTSRWAPKEFDDGEEGKKQYLADVAKDVRDTLINETPSWADAMLNALGSAPTIDGLTQTVTLINQTQSAFEAMALASSSFTNVSDELVNSLIKATGGAANLVSGLNYYYQNFFSEEERKLVMQQQVNAEFAKFNKEVPATRVAFRAMVDTAIAAGDSELVSNLLKVAPAFASITDTAEETTDALSEMLKSLKSEAKNLERDLIVASGGNVRAFDTSGMSAAEITQYDYNQSLRDQINAVKAATEASNAATEAAERRAEAVAQEKLGLEKELMQAVGDTASIRALELNALDATNRAIQEHIWAIEDTKTAYEKATDAASKAYSNLERSIDAEKTKLSTSYEIQKAALQSQLEIQKTAYQSQIDAAQASADKIRDIANALASAVKSVVLSTPALNLGKFKSAMQVVNSGNIYNPELENALDVVSGENQQFYSDFNSYAFDQAVMAANINSMNTAAQMQLSEAERTIQAIEQSMQVAQELVDKQLVELEKKHQEDLAKLQEQLDTGKAQLDALLGIDNSVLSVADAITALGVSIQAAYAAQNAQMSALQGAIAASKAPAISSGGGGASGGSAYVAKAWTDAELTALGFSPADIRATAARAAGAGASSGLDQYVNSIIQDGRDNLLSASGFNWTTMTDKTGRIFKDAGEVLSQWTSVQAVAAAEAWTNGGINGITSDELAHINSIKDTQAPGQLYSGSGSIDFGNVSTNTGQSYSAQDVAAAVKEVMAYGAQPDAIAQLAATQYGIDRESLQNIAAMYGIPGFATGINRVPYDIPAMIHKDEAVVPARFNPFNPNASSVNSDLTEAVNSLGARLEAIEANTRFAAIHANKTVKILQGVTQDGTSISTVAA